MSDQKLALRLLETRKQGFSYGLFLRRSKANYAFLFLWLGGLLPVMAIAESWRGFWILTGMVLGCVVRDVQWLRLVSTAWPFTEKVTDWAKVAALAQHEQPPA